jgi:hypothetical protein
MAVLNLTNRNPGLSEAAPAATSEFATRGGASAPLAAVRWNGAGATLTLLSWRRPGLPISCVDRQSHAVRFCRHIAMPPPVAVSLFLVPDGFACGRGP